MRGGLMQLVAYGAQDVYLTGDHIIGFEIYYKPHVINDIVISYEFDSVKLIKFTYSDINEMFNLKLESIDCSKISIKKLPHFKSYDDFNKLVNFNCSNCVLENINKLKYLKNLIYLNCSHNKINKLPDKFSSLKFINFSNNYVSELDCKFIKLKYLIGSSNKIIQVKNLPNSLVYLDLSDNRKLFKLTDLPINLEYLLITQTKINEINFNPESKLKYLDVSIGTFSNLNNLPNSLEYLNCSQINILNLDNLPYNLKSLICINNNLETLNMLPESLINLNCDHNNISDLDNLPNFLNQLICSHNKIKELSNLPKNLEYLDCSNNNIKLILNKPTKLKNIIGLLENKNNINNLINFWKIEFKQKINQLIEKCNIL